MATRNCIWRVGARKLTECEISSGVFLPRPNPYSHLFQFRADSGEQVRTLRLVGQLRSAAWVSWIATLLWIGIVALESTDLFSASHTGHLLSALLAMLHLHGEEQTVSYLNIVLRKLGHFVGYGVLSWLLFRAWKATLPVAAGWALRWAVLALFTTTLVASADEWHQTTIPSRAGRVQDVLLDDTGAAVTQCLLFFFP